MEARERVAPRLTTSGRREPNIPSVLAGIGRASKSVASASEVERSARYQLYGERPAVGVTARRGRPPGARDGAWLGRLVGGRYRLLERVGAGGMATVYRARDERLERHVAVKIIAERFVREPGYVRRFRREAQIHARLAHPNVVTVLDAGFTPRDFIVMELVEGINAGTMLKRGDRPSAGEAVHLVAQVCEGLAHAHDRGVIHQDVSPHNILIRSADATAKLADFGLASHSLDRSVRRETGGTPGYIAPEVLRGAPSSPSSDLYSLGVVAYKLLAAPAPAPRAGAAVSTAPLVTAVARRVPLAEARPGLPRPLSEAVERAVADDPAARQESVADFHAELLAAVDARLRRQRDTALRAA
jgi:eukaryotic-like serine/threonine-protein kinase